MGDLESLWHCEECSFYFGKIIPDFKRKINRCPYCGSSHIIKQID